MVLVFDKYGSVIPKPYIGVVGNVKVDFFKVDVCSFKPGSRRMSGSPKTTFIQLSAGMPI